MNTLSYKTQSANKETVQKEWLLIDAENEILGRLASKVANILRGKNTGYPGGQRSKTANELMAKKPFAMVEKAVKGMLPKNRLGAQLFRNLHVYAGTEHPHAGQNPKAINLNTMK